jgi:MoaA/NifB/PqqE/SkfB family radical SAM enzyme
MVKMSIPKFLVNDFVVMEDICNCSCQYCLTASSNFKDKHKFLFCEEEINFNLDKLLNDENSYREGQSLKNNIDFISDWIVKNTNTLILKLSGGEIFLVKNIIEYIKKVSPKYKRVQVLTNGTLLSESIISELSAIKNLCLQISMDGHTLQMNKYRVKNERMQQKLCNVLDLCSSYNIPVEINCVITNANLDRLYEFAGYLLKYTNVLLLPYVVRGKYRNKFIPEKRQICGLETLLDSYEEYKSVLPPEQYLLRLKEFLITGANNNTCYIPDMIFQTFDDGVITPCPNIWFKSLGNIIAEPDNIVNKMSSDPFYKVIDSHKRILDNCTSCFTPWEILNLFIENKVSLNELRNIYLFNDADIIEYFKELKNEIRNKVSCK